MGGEYSSENPIKRLLASQASARNGLGFDIFLLILFFIYLFILLFKPKNRKLLLPQLLNFMEEFEEAEVLWPDDSGGGKTAAAVAPATLGVKTPSRRRGAHSWAAGLGSRRNAEEYDDDDDDDDEDSGNCVIPPHVIAARRVSGDKMAFSVCVGNGRTLKGRDLCRVRNSVLKMTGFLEINQKS